MLFLRLWLQALCVSLAVLFTLKLLMPHPPVMYLYRMFMYPEEHPVQYALLVSGMFAAGATAWACWFGQSSGWQRHVGILLTLVLILGCTAPLAGMLWVIHDIQHGFWPGGERAMANLFWGAATALAAAPVIIGISFPLNVVAFLLAHRMADDAVPHRAGDNTAPRLLRRTLRRTGRDAVIIATLGGLLLLVMLLSSGGVSVQEGLRYGSAYIFYGLAGYFAGCLTLLAFAGAEARLSRRTPVDSLPGLA